MKEIPVFTDGACSCNGKAKAKAGIGVFFGEYPLKNISLELKEAFSKVGISITSVSNQKAELTAILFAIKSLENELLHGNTVRIYSDSMYSINVCTKWYKSWKRKEWRKANGSPVLNRQIIEKIVYLLEKYHDKIFFSFTASHLPEPPKGTKQHFIWFGNKMADLLAVKSLK
ncbi:MAG TPA: ribonuclease H family protein [Allocoleopsis sp.]